MTPQIYKTRDVLKNWGSVLAGFEKYLLRKILILNMF